MCQEAVFVWWTGILEKVNHRRDESGNLCIRCLGASTERHWRMGNERETSLPSWRRGFDSPHPLHSITTVSDVIWPVVILYKGARFPSLRLTWLLLITLVLSAAASTVDWLINLLETRHVIPLIVDAAAALVIFLITVATANWRGCKEMFYFSRRPSMTHESMAFNGSSDHWWHSGVGRCR